MAAFLLACVVLLVAYIPQGKDQGILITGLSVQPGELGSVYVLDYAVGVETYCVVLATSEHLDRFIQYLETLGKVSWLTEARK